MATIDVTDNGANSVVFNDDGEAANNGDALEAIFHTDAQDGDVIDFPFTAGDTLWVAANNKGTDGSRPVNLDVDDGLAQNLTVQGRTDANDEPVGKIRLDSGHTGWYYMFDLNPRGGLAMDWQHIRIDADYPNNSGSPSYALRIEHQDAAANNDITFHNCYIERGQEVVVLVRDVAGVHFEHCTIGNSENNAALGIIQEGLTDPTPRCTVKHCLLTNAATVGLNHSPGHVLLQDSVISSCFRGIKGGSEATGSDPDNEWVRVRLEDLTETGYHTVNESTFTSKVTVEDVIIDAGTGGNSIGVDLVAEHDFDVRDGSLVIIRGWGGDNIVVRDNAQILAGNADIQSCESGSDGIRYGSGASSTIDVYRYNANVDGPYAGSQLANLTVNTEEQDVACDADIDGVPTAGDVGVGTQSTSGTALRIGAARLGDGTGIVEARLGDGTVLFSSGETIIESWEEAAPLDDWNDDTGGVAVVDASTLPFDAPHGDNVLEMGPGGNYTITRTTGTLFSQGDPPNDVFVRFDNAGDTIKILYGLTDVDNWYGIVINTDDLARLQVRDGGVTTNLDTIFGFGWTADTLYRISPDWNNNDEHTVEIYNDDTDTLLGTLGPETDATHQGVDGIGVNRNASGGDTTTGYVDYWREVVT